jgi:hypothetical protein
MEMMLNAMMKSERTAHLEHITGQVTVTVRPTGMAGSWSFAFHVTAMVSYIQRFWLCCGDSRLIRSEADNREAQLISWSAPSMARD